MPGYRSVPTHVRDAIEALDGDRFSIGCTVRTSRAKVEDGFFEHLGVALADGVLSIGPSFVPGSEVGRWSAYNVGGREIVRRDLPKITKVIGSWQVPNFGDWSKGSHTHIATRDVLQREILYGQSVAIEVAGELLENEVVRLAVRVEQVFDRQALSEDDLLLACSLVRENAARHAQVVPAAETAASWLRHQRIDWELLPVGSFGPRLVDELKARIAAGDARPQVRALVERYEVLRALNPAQILVGTTGFARYVAFKFRDDLVVLENARYGNALYVMYEGWQELSAKSRADLLSQRLSGGYDRVIHKGPWPDRLRGLLAAHGHPPLADE